MAINPYESPIHGEERNSTESARGQNKRRNWGRIVLCIAMIVLGGFPIVPLGIVTYYHFIASNDVSEFSDLALWITRSAISLVIAPVGLFLLSLAVTAVDLAIRRRHVSDMLWKLALIVACNVIGVICYWSIQLWCERRVR
jgi:uncharacterized membrane protein YhaH (DUF805 family)